MPKIPWLLGGESQMHHPNIPTVRVTDPDESMRDHKQERRLKMTEDANRGRKHSDDKF